jgi:hypothetical protein
MLASTVQFSNNDQPPITPGYHRSSLGSALKAASRPCPQTPNSVPNVPVTRGQLSTPRRAVLAARDERRHRIINVPPLSNQHRTFADVLASDLTPKGSVRSAP